MEHDAWFFIGIFVFIFLIWIATGGPLHPLAFTGPSLAQPDVLGGGTYLQLPRAPYGIGGNTVVLPGSSSENSPYLSPGNTVPTFIGGSLFGSPSPYRGVVFMNHYVSSAGTENPANEYIEISVSQRSNGPVNISGWRLRSDASGTTAVIPKGTEVPVSGVINEAEDIVLAPGKRALIITGQSPIGASFRENKCIGYFSTFQKFSPALPQTCPAPSDELATYYGAGYIGDSKCIDYTRTLSRCQVTLSPPAHLSSTCQNVLIKHLNYNGCINAHKTDTDFSGDTWRVYLGRSASMWRTRNELVKLLDASGKTVDAFSY